MGKAHVRQDRDAGGGGHGALSQELDGHTAQREFGAVARCGTFTVAEKHLP